MVQHISGISGGAHWKINSPDLQMCEQHAPPASRMEDERGVLIQEN